MKFRLATTLTTAAVLMLSLATTARPAAAAIITSLADIGVGPQSAR